MWTYLLQIGDVIELKKEMRLYADIPKRFEHPNYRGDFSLVHSDVEIEGEFDYLAGCYIVTNIYPLRNRVGTWTKELK